MNYNVFNKNKNSDRINNIISISSLDSNEIKTSIFFSRTWFKINSIQKILSN